MTIPFVDLASQYRSIKEEIMPAVSAVLESTQFCLGRFVADFERDFAAYCGASFCVGVNSGTSALHLALLALGVGPGDEVLTTPHTFIATTAAVAYTGATPVFADVDSRTGLLDPDRLERAITPRTKAILPVHLYGQPVDMDGILRVADRHGIPVVEDAAQAHGAEDQGRRCGSMGRMACFSFYPGKNLGAYGEGGAVVTSDPELDKRLRVLRDWGQERKYHHDLLGYNYRMEGMQGAILGVKLRHLEAWTEARRSRAALYDRLLDGVIERPGLRAGVRHVYHIYAVLHPRRDALQKHLSERGIQTGIHYPIPVHLQKAFAALGHGPGSFPNAEKAASETLSLPMFPELTDEQVHEVCGAVREFQAGKA